MDFKIGDKVVINIKEIQRCISLGVFKEIPEWYSNEVYTIIDINEYSKLIYVNKNFNSFEWMKRSNTIHSSYLITNKQHRKDKLLKIKNC